MLMKMIADLHIHSRFSMATSKEGTPENLDFWARKKGISLIVTGDFTHPVWREELKERLVSEGNKSLLHPGIFQNQKTFHRIIHQINQT